MSEKARPPYVEFSTDPVETRDADGLPTVTMRDYVSITPVGSKDRVVREVKTWLESVEQQVKMGMMPREWYQHFKDCYKAYAEDRELPIDGTPIEAWPVVTKGEVKALKQATIRTVEDLAAANEEALARVGMGARSLKDRAQDWLQAKRDHAPLVAKLDSALRNLEGLQTKVDLLQKRNDLLEQALKMNPQASSLTVAVPSSAEYYGTKEFPKAPDFDAAVDNLQLEVTEVITED